MTEPIPGHQYRHAGVVVTVRSRIVTDSGRIMYLIEYEDGAFARAGAESLVPIEIGNEEKNKMPPVSKSVSGFMRRPSKQRLILK